jgi:hypothetical protein
MEIIRGEVRMTFRRRRASNRHWVFIKQEVLSVLNDQLALRHGAEYSFEVPESSFDWDVEFSVIKDRSGNTLREQYSKAWVQPTLVGPNDAVHQLGVRVNWKNPEIQKPEFDDKEITKLMAKVDEILGSPLETKEDTEEEKVAPAANLSSVTNQNKKFSSVDDSRRNKIAAELSKPSLAEESANKAVNIISQINNAKKLNDLDMQQIEIQKAYDEIAKMRAKPETLILGSMLKSIADKVRSSSIVDIDIYDILSRVGRAVTESYTLSSRSSDYKLQAINDIETKMMNLFEDTSLNESLVSLLKNYPIDFIQNILELSSAQIDALRNKSLNLDIVDDPAPQVVEEYVEDFFENPPTE